MYNFLSKYNENDVVQNRFDMLLFFDCKNGNPNGDPDSDNLPRIDDETNLGYVTDVCIKNKIRKYVIAKENFSEGYQIYINNDMPLVNKNDLAWKAITNENNKTEKKSKKEDKGSLPKGEDGNRITKWMCDNFYDVRTFGAVMTSNKVNAGRVVGPVQITFANSLNKINPQSISITRQAITKEDDFEKKETEMGRKTYLPYGLYVANVHVSPLDAKKSGFTYKDLNLLIEALLNMFDIDHSASRGEMSTQKLIVFEHESYLGNMKNKVLMHSHNFIPKTEYPRDINDFDFVKEDIKYTNVNVYELE